MLELIPKLNHMISANNCQHLYKICYKLNDNLFVNKVGCELYGEEVLIDSSEELAIKKLCKFC